MAWDIIIIGAGPTGMSAAIAAGELGLRTMILDRQPSPGGQIYQNIERVHDTVKKHLGKEYLHGEQLAKQFREARVTYLDESTVWFISAGKICYSRHGKSRSASASTILIASGAMERPVPLEGWTLPGVMSAGGADNLIKSSGAIPEGPVVVCGNGPLLLQSAVHMHKLGVTVAALVNTAPRRNVVRALYNLPSGLRKPETLLLGVRLLATMLKAHIPIFQGAQDLSISQVDDRLLLAFTNSRRKHTITARNVLLHEGILPENRLARFAGCNHIWRSDARYWQTETSIWGRTSVPGVWVAGDCGTVRGAIASEKQGRMAALDICQWLGRISETQRNDFGAKAVKIFSRMDSALPFMHAAFEPSQSVLLPKPGAVVCRCEELKMRDLEQFIYDGCETANSLKAQSRCGMGACQGRMCSSAVAEILSHKKGIDISQVEPGTLRAPLFPVPIGELAKLHAE